MLFSRSKNLVGLDIGDSSIKVVELQEKGRGQGYTLGTLACESLSPEAIVDVLEKHAEDEGARDHSEEQRHIEKGDDAWTGLLWRQIRGQRKARRLSGMETDSA